MNWLAAPVQPTLPFEVDYTKCTASRDGRRICTLPSTGRVEVGCVHEHVGWAWACSTHLPEIQKFRTDCGDCLVNFGHRCELLAGKVEML